MVEDWIGLEDIPSEWGTFCVDFDDHFWNWPCHWRSMAIIAMIEASAARWSAHSYVHRCCCERVAVLSTRCRGHHLRLFFLLSTAQKLAFLFWLAVYIAHLYLKDRASPGGTLFLLLLFLLLFFLLPLFFLLFRLFFLLFHVRRCLSPPPPSLPFLPSLPPSSEMTKYSTALCRWADRKNCQTQSTFHQLQLRDSNLFSGSPGFFNIIAGSARLLFGIFRDSSRSNTVLFEFLLIDSRFFEIC